MGGGEGRIRSGRPHQWRSWSWQVTSGRRAKDGTDGPTSPAAGVPLLPLPPQQPALANRGFGGEIDWRRSFAITGGSCRKGHGTPRHVRSGVAGKHPSDGLPPLSATTGGRIPTEYSSAASQGTYSCTAPEAAATARVETVRVVHRRGPPLGRSDDARTTQ